MHGQTHGEAWLQRRRISAKERSIFAETEQDAFRVAQGNAQVASSRRLPALKPWWPGACSA
jgi:hypothetical protein